MVFQLKHTKADAEGFKKSALINIEGIRKQIDILIRYFSKEDPIIGSVIMYLEQRILWHESNYQGWDEISKEHQFPVNIEFDLTTDGFYKRIVA